MEQSSKGRKKLNFRWIEILFVLAFFSCCANSWSADAKYDKTRYDQMQHVIDADTNKLLGISLQNASKLLSLENVKWDEGYTSVPRGQLRVYHFPGFCLLLSLQKFPRGITPDSHGQFSINDSELRSNSVRWVANFYPALHIDGIANPKERMSNYWEQVHAGFEKRTEEMNKNLRQKTLANSAVDVQRQQWIAFASSRHASDLLLLKKKLQDEQIHCMNGESERYTDSLLVESNDFARARTVAIKIITRNSLTVNLEVDANSNGYELWENGKKVGEKYF